jgi:integrase
MTIEYLLKSKREKNYIYIAIYQNDETALISTGETIPSKAWSKASRRPIDQSSDISINIEKIKSDILKVRRLMVAHDKEVTAYSLQQEYLKQRKARKDKQTSEDQKEKTGSNTIAPQIDRYMNDGLTEYRKSTAKAVKESMRVFKAFLKSAYPGLERRDLSLDIINDYARFLEVKKKLKDSTHGKRMKHLRWFLKWLKFDQVSDVKIRTIKPGERNIIHLTMDELSALEAVDVSFDIEMQKAKDMFLLGCYTGLRVSDLKRISPHRIENNAIEITLEKNRKAISIPLLSQTNEILSRYEYSAPRISAQQVNESIKEVCQKAGIDKKIFFKSKKKGQLIETLHPKYKLITTHVAGKTFISLAAQRWGLTPTDIAAIVGKDIKTVLGYYLKPDAQLAKEKMINADNRDQMKVAR